jgi:hypothetical protein
MIPSQSDIVPTTNEDVRERRVDFFITTKSYMMTMNEYNNPPEE